MGGRDGVEEKKRLAKTRKEDIGGLMAGRELREGDW